MHVNTCAHAHARTNTNTHIPHTYHTQSYTDTRKSSHTRTHDDVIIRGDQVLGGAVHELAAPAQVQRLEVPHGTHELLHALVWDERTGADAQCSQLAGVRLLHVKKKGEGAWLSRVLTSTVLIDSKKGAYYLHSSTWRFESVISISFFFFLQWGMRKWYADIW